MTFIYELDHFRDTSDLQKRQGFRKLSSDIHTDYRETEKLRVITFVHVAV